MQNRFRPKNPQNLTVNVERVTERKCGRLETTCYVMPVEIDTETKIREINVIQNLSTFFLTLLVQIKIADVPLIVNPPKWYQNLGLIK